MEIFVIRQEAKCVAKGDGRDDIEGKVLGDSSKIDLSEDCTR